MIQFHQVEKRFPGNDFSIGELSFNIEEGEFTFLIGPSGSGKTTIIRMLIREEDPTAGKIYFDDYDITKLSRDNVYKLRRQIGVIFQDYKLIPDKTAYENVAFAMEAAGRTNAEIRETVPYVLDIVGLSHREEAFPKELSGGEKQRVAIARAVANNPRVLIADEPTGNLDPASAWDIVQILSKINNWGTTVLMSTHGTDIVNSLNKRVIQMEGGKIVRDDSKGRYEITDPERTAAPEAAPEPEETKKGPFKVMIKSRGGNASGAAAGNLFGLTWLGFGKQKNDVPLIDEDGEVGDGEYESVDMEEAIPGDAEKVVAKADKTPVSKLDLRPEVIADLESAGYNDVEDIINAGPEQLQNELMIDPEEVVDVAKALEKFVVDTSVEEAKKAKKTKSGSKTKSKTKSGVDLETESDQSKEPEVEEPKPVKKPKKVNINLANKK